MLGPLSRFGVGVFFSVCLPCFWWFSGSPLSLALCVWGLFFPTLLFPFGRLFCCSPSSPLLQPSLLWFCRKACFVCTWALRLQGPCTSGSPLRGESCSRLLCLYLRDFCCFDWLCDFACTVVCKGACLLCQVEFMIVVVC